ncbi:MAG: choice-of-anchor I family protein [Luteibaculum sp.]
MKKLLLACSLLIAVGTFAQSNISLIGTYKTMVFDEGAAEIVAYDSINQQVFFTNADAASIGILDVSDPSNPSFIKNIEITTYGSNANSVAVSGNVVVAAVESTDGLANGKAVFFDLDGNYITDVEVGNLPDMVTISSDGNIVMTANEGEPSDDYLNDPIGSISIIDISGGVASLTQANVTTLDFSGFTPQMLDASTRVFGNDGAATVAQDMEPEYITISPDNSTAFVGLQENNAVAIVDLNSKTITDIVGLGFKNHALPGNGFDASNRAEQIAIIPRQVFGMPLPDAIKSFEIAGQTYFATANEGDSRDYDAFSEEERVADLVLDLVAFPNRNLIQNDTVLGRLNITTTLGDTDNDGEYEELYAYGTRSFSIYDATGNLVYDSGDDFEQTIAADFPEQFNSTNDDNDSYKNRSDDKGPEPEAIEIATIGGATYAFIGMERMGGIFVYDISNPIAPINLGYFLNRNFSVPADDSNAGDLGVEDIKFVPAAVSPTGFDMLITANEISGTVSFFSVDVPTSVKELNNEKNSFKLFPNPNNGSVVRTNIAGDYRIVDLQGREVLSVKNSTSLNLDTLTPGTYLVSNASGTTQKLFISK